jgi:hypothetical protein
MENILFVVITFAFLTLMSAHVYFTNQFFDRLKDAHASVWKELGQPRWKIHFGDPSFQIAMKYIRQKKFSDLNDTELDVCYKKLKWVERSALLMGLLIFSATLVDVLY